MRDRSEVDAIRARMDSYRGRLELPVEGPTWRDVAPICLPGWLISKGISAITGPLVLAGPEAVKRLQPYAERLCDIPSPSRCERIKRDALLWLIGERGNEPEAKEAETLRIPSLPSDVPEQSELRQEKQKPSDAPATSKPAEFPPSSHSGTPQANRGRHQKRDRGVR